MGFHSTDGAHPRAHAFVDAVILNLSLSKGKDPRNSLGPPRIKRAPEAEDPQNRT